MRTTGTAFAAGSVIEVRDEEWIVSSCEPAGDGWKVRCVGSSELVRSLPATFYSTLDEIETLDPAQAELVQDDSLHLRRSRLWVEAVPRKTLVPHWGCCPCAAPSTPRATGWTGAELCVIYRTQFSVLRKYERVLRFDAHGRQVPKDVLQDVDRWGRRADLGRYQLPFMPVDREAEMTTARAELTRRLKG